MKFLCDNCKAKYQIGDDKVAGKTVRMKCRRCGHSITVSSKVTESSVSRQLPTDPNEPTYSVHPSDAAPESGAGPRPPRPAPPSPHRQPMRSDDDESTTIMQLPLRPDPSRAPGAPPRRPGAPTPAPPRPFGGGAPAAARAPAPPRPVAALRSPAAAPVRDLRPQAPLQSVPNPAPSPPQPAVEPGGVAAAFQRAVADPNATSASRHPPHEDWYVGVGGVPLGPVRVDVIREKALLGQVDGDSLVWREGFDEWQPLKKFPELLEVVHGARMARIAPKTAPMSAMTEPMPGGYAPRPSGIGAAAALAAPVGGVRSTGYGQGSYGTQAMPQAPAAFSPAAAAPPAPVQHAAAVSVLADPFAAPAAPGPSKPAPEPPEPAPDAVNLFSASPAVALSPAVPAPAPTPAPSPFAAGPSSAELSAIIPRPRQGMHPMAIAFIAMAAVFGGVAAYFLFFKPQAPPQVVVQVVEKTVPAPGSTAAASSDPQAAAEPSASPSAKPVAGTGRGRPAAVAAAPSAAPAAPGDAPIDRSGFNNGGVAGPSAGNPGGTPGGGTGQLSAGEIQGVVSSNQARIRRQCWEPALAGRAANGPTNARVNGQITIGPSGNVENATANGGDSFPGLSSCIAGKMRSWKFPASGGSQTVNVPFVFAGQ